MSVRRIPISFNGFNRVVMGLMGLGPARSFVDVGDDEVTVRMGWAFRASFPRASVQNPRRGRDFRITAGAHGWRGRWLVNGNPKGIVEFDIEPPVKAKVIGLPVRLKNLSVSVDDLDAVIAALTA